MKQRLLESRSLVRIPCSVDDFRLTERRRSRTDPAWGYHALLVLKTSWATGPGRSAGSVSPVGGLEPETDDPCGEIGEQIECVDHQRRRERVGLRHAVGAGRDEHCCLEDADRRR